MMSTVERFHCINWDCTTSLACFKMNRESTIGGTYLGSPYKVCGLYCLSCIVYARLFYIGMSVPAHILLLSVMGSTGLMRGVPLTVGTHWYMVASGKFDASSFLSFPVYSFCLSMSSRRSCDLAPSTVAYFPIAMWSSVSLFFSPSIIIFPFYHPPPLSSCVHHPSPLPSPPLPSSFYIIHHPPLLPFPLLPSSFYIIHHPPPLTSSPSPYIIFPLPSSPSPSINSLPLHHLPPIPSSPSLSIISPLPSSPPFHNLSPLCRLQMPLSSRRLLVK